MKKRRIPEAITPEKRSRKEEYNRQLNESVNEIGKVYVRQEIRYYRTGIHQVVDRDKLTSLERIESDMDNGILSGGSAHKMVNKIIYGHE